MGGTRLPPLPAEQDRRGKGASPGTHPNSQVACLAALSRRHLFHRKGRADRLWWWCHAAKAHRVRERVARRLLRGCSVRGDAPRSFRQRYCTDTGTRGRFFRHPAGPATPASNRPSPSSAPFKTPRRARAATRPENRRYGAEAADRKWLGAMVRAEHGIGAGRVWRAWRTEMRPSFSLGKAELTLFSCVMSLLRVYKSGQYRLTS